MPLGAGLCPVGTCAAGHGVPDAGTVISKVPYPDANTGLSQTGPLISASTLDYVYTADGRVQGAPTAQVLVQSALTTVFGSSAIATFGLQLSDLKDKTSNFDKRLLGRVTSALQFAVSAGIISIRAVQSLPVVNPDGAAGFVLWKDLTAPAVSPSLAGGAPTNEYRTTF